MSSYSSGTTTSGGVTIGEITGSSLSSGTYSNGVATYTFNSNGSCTKEMGGQTYTGTWSYSGYALTIDTSLDLGSGNIIRAVENYSSAFTTDSGQYLFLYSWRQSSGTSAAITGSYTAGFSTITYLNGVEQSSSSTTMTITYNADGTWTSSTDVDGSVSNNSGNWDTTSAAAIQFVNFSGERFLYTGSAGALVRQ